MYLESVNSAQHIFMHHVPIKFHARRGDTNRSDSGLLLS